VNGAKFAVSFCIPLAMPGLKFVCRDSVAGSANRFDHALSSRFDEQCTFVIFDDVEVPRSRMFIGANVKVYNQVMTRSWNPNVMQQTMVRHRPSLNSPGVSRLRWPRLAWDYAGTTLASRVELYERFYLTPGARNQQRAHALAKRDRAMALVERLLSEPVD
jgi:aromatic ring hydroxylase